MNAPVVPILPVQRSLLHAMLLAALVCAPMASAMAAPLAAATLTVNSLADPGDGTCDLSECTLREAIAAASSGDTVDFSVSGTITLTAGELLIDKDLIISGPGTESLTIDANRLSRVIHVLSTYDSGTMTAHPVAATLNDLTLYFGDADTAEGGGILNEDQSPDHQAGVLTLNRVRVNYNLAASGGGVANSGTLIMGESLIDENGADTTGGGIANSGILTLSGSSLVDNNAGTQGGGLHDTYQSAISESTIRQNSAGTDGGGIACDECTLTVSNSTLSGNRGWGVGGGVANGSSATGGSMTFSYTTIARNQAPTGGGVASIPSGGSTPTATTAEASIIAGNTGYTSHPDVDGAFVSQGYNLIGDGTGSTGFVGTGDQVGSAATPIDPVLAGIVLNGGTTTNITPRAGSPAIDAGGSPSCPAADQRGCPRPRDGDRNGSAICDIGAVEVNAATFTVNSLDDPGDGSCDAPECTLREAIETSTAGDLIQFSLTGTITLTAGELVVDKDLTITGPGASRLTLDGNHASRVLRVFGSEDMYTDEVLEMAHLTLSGVTIQNGEAGASAEGGGILITSEDYERLQAILDLSLCVVRSNHALGGGGIRNIGTASISDCLITDNTADEGGGIHNFGELAITRTTVSDNAAVNEGGGLYDNYHTDVADSTISGNGAGTLGGGSWCVQCEQTFTNSTISGNVAGDSGGGIANGNLYNGGTVTLAYSTLTQNTAPTGGGIIAIDGSGYQPTIASLQGTIVAGNTGTTLHPDVDGVFTSQGYNLVGDGTGATGFTGTGDQVGTGAVPIDALLGPLFYNGGPTQTHNLLPGSPAIDSADDASCPADDQRGWERPRDGDANGSAICDIGAIERQGWSLFLPLVLRNFIASD